MIPLPIFSQRVFVIASISAVAAILAGLLLYQIDTPLARALGHSAGAGVSSANNTVYLSGAGAAASTTTVENPVLEVHIAANGLVLLRGARVLSVSGSTLRVGMTWGSSDFTWLIQTTSATKFLNAHGEPETASSLRIGDIVTVTGKVARGGGEPLINAEFVRM